MRNSGINVTLQACLQAPVRSSQSLKPTERRKTKTDWSPNIRHGSYQLRLASTEDGPLGSSGPAGPFLAHVAEEFARRGLRRFGDFMSPIPLAQRVRF